MPRARKTDPLDALAEAAAAIAAGDRERRLPAVSDPHLGGLVAAVNAIVDTLAAKEKLLGDNIQSLQTVNRELREAHDSLVQHEKLATIGRVSAGIAHEIGNPIGAILGYLDLIKRRSVVSDDLRDSLSRMEAEARRISSIIRELLDFARPSPSVLEPLEVGPEIAILLDDLSQQAAFAAVSFERELAARLPVVQINRNRFRQVLVNLLTNARDATEGTGVIGIVTRILESAADQEPTPALPPRRSTDPPEVDYSHLRPLLEYDPTPDRPLSAESRWVEVRVSDRGTGIAPEFLREIFDPFFTTKPPGQGTGLGLPLSLSIIRSFRGRMQVISEVGIGTTVIIQLPVAL